MSLTGSYTLRHLRKAAADNTACVTCGLCVERQSGSNGSRCRHVLTVSHHTETLHGEKNKQVLEEQRTKAHHHRKVCTAFCCRGAFCWRTAKGYCRSDNRDISISASDERMSERRREEEGGAWVSLGKVSRIPNGGVPTPGNGETAKDNELFADFVRSKSSKRSTWRGNKRGVSRRDRSVPQTGSKIHSRRTMRLG